MNSPPPGTADAGLEDADYAAPRPAGIPRSMHPLQMAAFVVLFLILALVAFIAFLAIAVGVTILVAKLIPTPNGAAGHILGLVAPIAGVGVASLCFGAASRFRKGMFKNRYGLFRRPPRDLGKPPAEG
jgi:hypothetical protein